jgi:threonine dehydratase
MVLAFTELKIVLEPSGAIALGALLASGLESAGKCVGVVASGGNLAVERFKELVA